MNSTSPVFSPSHSKTRPFLPGLLFALCSVAIGSLHAIEVVKDDNVTDLDNGASWVGGGPPGGDDVMVFDSVFTQAGAITTGAPLGVSGVKVTGGTTTVNINNTLHPVTVGAAGVDMSAAGRDLIIQYLSISASQFWNVAVGRTFTIGFQSLLTGDYGIEKKGAGTVILDGDYDYTGGTTVSEGTLKLGSGIFSPTWNGTYAISAGATLHLHSLSANSSRPTWANVSGAGTFRLQSDGTGTANGDWSTASLPATFTGTLHLQSGRVYAADANALGTASKVIVGAGGQLGLWNGGTFTQPMSLAGTGYGETGYESALRLASSGNTTTLTGPVTLTGNTTVGAAGTGIFEGQISGGYALTVGTTSQTGTVTLRAANNYTGATSLFRGTLKLENGNNRLPSGTTLSFTGTSSLNVGTVSQSVAGMTLATSVTATIAGSGGSLTAGGTFTLGKSSTFSVSSGASVILATMNQTNDGTTTRNVNGTLNVTTYYGASRQGNSVNAFCTLNVNAGGTATMGTMYLAGNGYDNYNTVQDTINVAGTLNATTINGWLISGSGGLVTVNRYINVNAGGRLNTTTINLGAGSDSNNTHNRLLSLNGGTLANITTGNMTVDSTTPVNMAAGGGTIDISAGRTGTINGVMGSSGSFVKTGDGTLVLANAANTHSGTKAVNTGTLSLTGKLTGGGALSVNNAAILTQSTTGAISGAASLTHNSSATSTLAGVNAYTGATLLNAGTLSLTGSLTGGTAITVANAAILTQSTTGAISGAASLTHNSSATSTLSGVNSYSNPTVVNNGKLLVHGSLSSAGLVTVKAGATFGGGGSAGHVTVEDLAFLSPGKPDFTENRINLNSLALVADSILLFDLADPIPDGVYTLPFYSDHIALQGNLTLAGKLRVNPRPGFDASPDNRWMLMSYAVGSGVFTDNHLAVDVANSPGLPLPPDGFRYVIDTSEPGYVFLTVAVPEPATGALLAFGLLLLGRAIRRRR